MRWMILISLSKIFSPKIALIAKSYFVCTKFLTENYLFQTFLIKSYYIWIKNLMHIPGGLQYEETCIQVFLQRLIWIKMVSWAKTLKMCGIPPTDISCKGEPSASNSGLWISILVNGSHYRQWSPKFTAICFKNRIDSCLCSIDCIVMISSIKMWI